MSALFPRGSNSLLRASLVLALLTPALVIGGAMAYVRSPYATRQHVGVEQPVAFDHRHHVQDAAIPCLYCHSSAESEASAGVPSASVCMGCHVQVRNQSPLLRPVRDAHFSARPLSWNRVYALADFVQFHHGVHVRAGLQCARCHGDVSSQAAVYRVRALHMSFCMDCHRDVHDTAQSGALPGPLSTCTACHQ